MKQVYHHSASFELESGRNLSGFHLAYTTWGALNEDRDNVVWIFHALTANSDPAEWWHGLVGRGRCFDPDRDYIVCVNMPGSCYGSVSPLDINAETGEPFYYDFPVFTTRDMIRAYQHLKARLGIERIRVGIGGSMGGQQLLEWAVEEPGLFESIIPIATNAVHSPWAIAFNATQRMCIENDASWGERNAKAGIGGMKAARAVALLSYRSYQTYQAAQQGQTPGGVYKAETYQRYQGGKLAARFNAFSYYFLSKSMDAHNLGRGRPSVAHALGSITARTLVIGIRSDVLFPVQEQEYLAEQIPAATLALINSHYGHDGFLLEFEKIEELAGQFLNGRIYRNTKSNISLKELP